MLKKSEEEARSFSSFHCTRRPRALFLCPICPTYSTSLPRHVAHHAPRPRGGPGVAPPCCVIRPFFASEEMSVSPRFGAPPHAQPTKQNTHRPTHLPTQTETQAHSFNKPPQQQPQHNKPSKTRRQARREAMSCRVDQLLAFVACTAPSRGFFFGIFGWEVGGWEKEFGRDGEGRNCTC